MHLSGTVATRIHGLGRAALLFLSASAALIATGGGAAGCVAPPTAVDTRDGDGDDEGVEQKEGPGGTTSKPGGDDATQGDDPTATTETGALALVVIDVQNTFVSTASRRNPGAKIADVVARTGRLLTIATQKKIPTFVTYEASKTGDHALAPSLVPLLPPQQEEFIKTTFAATGQPQFLPAIKASGAKRLVVVGAETEVCVMQTMLGLRRAGYSVLAVTDDIFTEEVNVAPAQRRMKQAGIVQIKSSAAETLLDSSGPSAASTVKTPPVIARPLEMGFVLHDIGGLNAVDPASSQKLARLKELLYVSEWFQRPVYAENPQAATAALPANLRSILKKAVQPLSSKPANITQLAIAGGRNGVAGLAATLAKTNEVFLPTDVLVGTTDLEAVIAGGAVSTTYKSLYYELMQSVDDAQWPSAQWVTNSNPYYDLTQAPEDLPQLAPSGG